MRRTLRIALLLGLSLAALPEVKGTTTIAPAVRTLLERAGLRYSPPAGFRALPPRANPILPYEIALRDASGALEIRYAIRPLAGIEIEYQDPHSSAPRPDDLFPMLFNSIVEGLSGRGYSPTRQYPAAQAHRLFHAGWASAAVLDVLPEFSSGLRRAVLIAIHRDGLADAYIVYLFNDYARAKPLIDATLGALRFRAPATTGRPR